MPEIKGTLKSIVYRNEDNDYSIVKILTEDDLVETINGYLQKIKEGVKNT